MNIYDLTIYVNQDADDTFSFREVALWFNKAIANFNLIPPVTKYPFITVDNPTTDSNDEFLIDGEFNDNAEFGGDDDEIGAKAEYPLKKNFMLGVILPYIVSAIKSAESSVTEKQIMLQEFLSNARQYKSISNIPAIYLEDSTQNLDIEEYKLGENVYVSDMRYAPFSDNWSKATIYYEIKDEEE